MADDLKTIVQRMIDAGESEDNIATVIQSFSQPSSPAKTKAGTSAGLMLAAGGHAVPLAANLSMRAATSPNVPKYGSILGQLVGGIEGLRHEGPMGAAAGVWAGGKAGWFSGKLAQRLGAPVAAVMDKVAPYAQTLSTLGAGQGALDLAQMAEPNRSDIGVLGVGPSLDEDRPPLVVPHGPMGGASGWTTPNPLEQARRVRDAIRKRLQP